MGHLAQRDKVCLLPVKFYILATLCLDQPHSKDKADYGSMFTQRKDHYGSAASGFSERTNHSLLLLRRLDGRLQFLGGARQALAVEARRVCKGSFTPLRCVNVEP